MYSVTDSEEKLMLWEVILLIIARKKKSIWTSV